MVPFFPGAPSASSQSSRPPHETNQGLSPNPFLPPAPAESALVWHAPYSGPGQTSAPREWNFIWSKTRRPKSTGENSQPEQGSTFASASWKSSKRSSVMSGMCEQCSTPVSFTPEARHHSGTSLCATHFFGTAQLTLL